MKDSENVNDDEEPDWVQSHHAAQKAADAGDTAQAQMQTMQAFAQIMESADETLAESISLRELKIAHECEAAFDWDGAEAAFQRAIEAEIAEEGTANQGWSSLRVFVVFWAAMTKRCRRLGNRHRRRGSGTWEKCFSPSL